MKRFTTLLFALLIFGFTNAQTLKYSYSFDTPTVKKEKLGYSQLIYENCRNLGAEGSPSIPLFAADILLPQNTEIQSIKIVSTNYYQKIADIKIKPASRQFPLSKPDNNYVVTPNEAIYNSNNIFPENKLNNFNTHFLAGHSIGSFTICPIEYTPSENKVKFIKNIEVEITLKSTNKAANNLRTNSNIKNRITKIVDNPAALKNYSYTKDLSEYDILLISNNVLLPEFQDYIDFKTSTGYAIATVTVENIYTSYSGADNQEKIRNCITDYYQNYGISYVILGGDADPATPVVPHRGFYSNTEYGYDDSDIPSDMYFSCLDGNWNTNGNGYWGEPGEDDLYAEVSIGRLCVDNATEIENSTHKLYMYQNEPVIDDIEKALMIGELLWDGIWGKMYKTQIETGGTFDGYTTIGIGEEMAIEQLYEQDGNWSHSQVFAQYNTTGVNLLNHLGHCDVTYNMTMYNSDINTTNFQNNGVTRGYAIEYSQGCYCGSYDNRTTTGSYTDDCFSEVMTGFENGNVAFISNSRYGWGDNTGTNGSSHYYDREFFDAIFGENITQIGDADRDSREDNIGYIDYGANRWCMYETTLFGDPSMDIWTAQPTSITANYNAAVSIGTTQITFITDAPYARVGLMQNGELIGRGVADETGTAIVNMFEAITSAEIIDVSIIAHNRNRVLETISVFSDQPYVIYNSNIINDNSGNSNGLADYSESIILTVAMQNVGTVGTSNVEVTLSTTDEYITITDATESYGSFSAEQTIELTNVFAFDIADNVPDAHVVLFTVTAVSAGTEWQSNFTMIMNAPVLQIAFNQIDDNSSTVAFVSTPITEIDFGASYNYDITIEGNAGDGDGMLDAGETASITINTANNGHADLFDATCTLTSTSEYVTINTTEFNFETIAVGDELPAVYSITINEDTPIGQTIELIFTLVGGEYQEIFIFNPSIGLQIEDFETGDFLSYNWIIDAGNADWTIDTDAYEGTNSAKSGTITDDQYSELSITCDVSADGEISFWSKVSSEVDYDYLRFYIDANQQDQWAGNTSWAEQTYDVSAGLHTFKWIYEKDGSVTNGSDCAWVDFITFPGFSSASKSKGIVITAPTLPTWLEINDNGDGTANLHGTAPTENSLHEVIIQAVGTGEPVRQEYEIQVGLVSINSNVGIIKFYPNPTTDNLNIQLPNTSDNAQIIISDISGKIIHQSTIKNHQTTIDLSNQAKGVYTIKLTIDNEIINQKIIVE